MMMMMVVMAALANASASLPSRSSGSTNYSGLAEKKIA
jgi:hypothetical protein